jgi:ABC-type enterochelin transport system substrate-binding protein
MAAETSKIDPVVERRLSAIETRVAELAEQVNQLAHILGRQDKLAKEIATIKYESREAEEY